MAKVEQKGNVVGGHMAGGDINVTNVYPELQASPLRDLLEKFAAEKSHHPEIAQIIDGLQFFMLPSQVRPEGVAAKLEAAGRSDDVPEAEKLKELFNKRLTRLQFSPTAQEILAYLLGNMATSFKAKAMPVLADGSPRHVVDQVLAADLVEPTMKLVEGNPSLLNHQEAWGMLYYLTGNCHLVWRIP